MFPSIPISHLIAGDYVARHPLIARQRISERYSCVLAKNGCNIEGIADLREMIRKRDSNLKFARALFISAPHTHWEDEKIVESFDAAENLILNGPVPSTDHCGELRPVSFVFSADGPIPYEWADQSVRLRSIRIRRGLYIHKAT